MSEAQNEGLASNTSSALHDECITLVVGVRKIVLSPLGQLGCPLAWQDQEVMHDEV